MLSRFQNVTTSPSRTIKNFVTVFISVSIILLAVTLIPNIPKITGSGVYMYETDFTGTDPNSIVNIGDVVEVTQILWGTWNACYKGINATSTTGTSSLICIHAEFVNNPYNFTVEGENNTQATVQQLWIRVLFLQLIGLIFAIFIALLLLVRCFDLKRQSKRLSAAGTDPGKAKVWNFTNILTALLWVWITIIVICNAIVLTLIQKEMQTLGPGVNTKPAPGFWLPVTADAFILVTFFVVIGCIKSRTKLKKVEDLPVMPQGVFMSVPLGSA